MKKILILGIIILSIFLIYLTTIDKKVYYLVLGDEIALGYTKEDKYEKNHNDYVKEYLKEKNKLEIYSNEYVTQDYRITDIIKDIETNKIINKKTLKNSLIKSDLIILSIGTNDIISKIDNMNKLTKIDYNKLYKNIDEIINDLDKLLKLIREYSKEDIIMTGIYIEPHTEELEKILDYANKKFKQTTQKYNVEYIDMYEIIKKTKPLNKYPNKEEYKIISDKIIDKINNNLLK